MEILQDWRIYGLRIYYNTTAPGHIDKAQWLGYIADLQAAHSSHIAGMRYWLNTIDITQALRQMTGNKTIQLRGVQAATGGGKSILFILPAFTEPSRTIIIVKSCRPPDEATIVLVTPESAVTEDFHTFINRLKQTRQLDRIFIREPVLAFIRQRIRQAGPGKVIIYTNIIRQVIELAQKLEYKAYYSQQINKLSILQRLIQS
ncbi:hypothetical protein BDV24DRAFT_156976 [Aspergillus arachidicola]|uniref:Helicase ATP-binding domain-containing protein n=1 Tax=Aspergillus arachidicola TaxID=656916 RepID=A0A5N6XRQ6_9EURO|nr:hypothetical protein BDV24DRAFT_156976 [Aspergillus arachidicola]